MCCLSPSCVCLTDYIFISIKMFILCSILYMKNYKYYVLSLYKSNKSMWYHQSARFPEIPHTYTHIIRFRKNTGLIHFHPSLNVNKKKLIFDTSVHIFFSIPFIYLRVQKLWLCLPTFVHSWVTQHKIPYCSPKIIYWYNKLNKLLIESRIQFQLLDFNCKNILYFIPEFGARDSLIINPLFIASSPFYFELRYRTTSLFNGVFLQ